MVMEYGVADPTVFKNRGLGVILGKGRVPILFSYFFLLKNEIPRKGFSTPCTNRQKDRLYNGHKKNDKQTSNGPENTT
jgi:hypothetical protein